MINSDRGWGLIYFSVTTLSLRLRCNGTNLERTSVSTDSSQEVTGKYINPSPGEDIIFFLQNIFRHTRGLRGVQGAGNRVKLNENIE